MPSTFTTNTGLEKIGDGEQSGLWGDTTNANFDIIDRGLNGVSTIVLATTSHTLTTSSGTLSDGQYAAITFTGTPGGTSTVTISPATAQKTYAIRNSTNQSIILTQGSGGNVTLAAGASAIVACTGAGASSAVFDITALMNTATSVNTANAVVRRDGSGNFTAATITANVTGNVTGDITTTSLTLGGTAVTATAAEINTLDGIAPTGAGFGYVPQGGIIMWSGAIGAIPAGWLLCDGTNGTPNLQNRFIVGAGDTHTPGATGGADSVTLAEANLPSHTHSFSATTGAGGNHQHSGETDPAGAHNHTPKNGNGFLTNTTSGADGTFNYGAGSAVLTGVVISTSDVGNHAHTFTTSFSGDHTHTVSGTTGATGSGTAIDNRPAFYALAYIMKA